jgi:hypothetical protein
MSLSRRNLLKASAALGAAAALKPSLSFAQTATEKTSILIIHLDGGYNSLFGSADSFVGAGSFGVTGSNTLALGGGLVVDAPTFGTMPQSALDKMASVGVRHGLTAHDAANTSIWSTGGRNYATILAQAMGGEAAIKAAVVGSRMPEGPRPSESGVSLQAITDMRATIVALGGALDPTVPNRNIATEALSRAELMSKKRLLRSPNSLRSVTDGYTTGVDALKKQGLALDYNALATAYGISNTTTAVSNFRTQMVAAELMVMAGANVITAIDGGWDTHGDTDGNTVRSMMNQRILPPLNTFLSRMMADPTRNVITVILGDFARSLPNSDHQGNMTATVIGKYVKPGTTGRVDANVSLAPGTPGVMGLWSYLATIGKNPVQMFGPNPHGAITLS